MTIRIFVTGGTFDKEYDEIREAFIFKNTHLPEILKVGRSIVDVDIRTLMMIDSLQMADEDRQSILRNCQRTKQDKIIVTHGTGTMEDTARVLSTIKDKTIVLTGAMIPYAYGSSDGLFNLGAALAFVQALAPGVYVAMNGSYFKWDNVTKNTKTGYFEVKQ